MAQIETRINDQQDLITFTVTGCLGVKDILDTIQISYADTPKKLILWDVSNITSFTLTPTELEDITNLISTFKVERLEGKTAFVIGAENFGFGILYENLARMKKLPYEYRSFENTSTARKWLGV